MAIGLMLLVPLVGGGLIGYNLGHTSTPAEIPVNEASYETAPFQESRSRDSVSAEVSQSRRNAITRTVADASPAVVGITVTEVRQYRYRNPWGDDPFFRQFFGDQTYTQRVQGLGSGFLISADGYILTNDHVAGNAKEITVTLTNAEKYKADLVGTDMISDIALLKIDG
ncbi:hypothetical protein EHM92_07680, partial [bacterium]